MGGMGAYFWRQSRYETSAVTLANHEPRTALVPPMAVTSSHARVVTFALLLRRRGYITRPPLFLSAAQLSACLRESVGVCRVPTFADR